MLDTELPWVKMLQLGRLGQQLFSVIIVGALVQRGGAVQMRGELCPDAAEWITSILTRNGTMKKN